MFMNKCNRVEQKLQCVYVNDSKSEGNKIQSYRVSEESFVRVYVSE